MPNKELLNYSEYQKQVFDWLLEKHEQDPVFTFSTRQKGSQGAELNYFIGTEKSNYFGTTFWTIPVSFPGSAGDLIDVFFTYSNAGYYFYIEFVQTTSPEDKQNSLALELIESIKNQIGTLGSFEYETGPKNRMFKYELSAPRPGYNSLSEMLDDLLIMLNKLLPIVENGIQQLKTQNPEFIAHRITKDEFQGYTERLERRFQKYEHLNNYDENNEDLSDFLRKFEPSELESYFSFLKEIASRFELKPGDERLVFNVHSRRGHLSFTVGQRYCLSLNSKDQRGHFGIISKDSLFDNSEQFSGNQPRPWFSFRSDLQLSSDQKENVLAAIQTELNRSPRSGFRQFNKPEFESFILGSGTVDTTTSKVNEISKTEAVQSPLNVILYGPPGTGKTFKLKSEYFTKYTTVENTLSRDEYLTELLKDQPWWKVVALVLLKLNNPKVSEIRDHEFILAKERGSNSTTIKQTIWGQLQAHTVDKCAEVNVSRKLPPFIFYKNEDSTWQLDQEGFDLVEEEINALNALIEGYQQQGDKVLKRYDFITFHQSYAYEDFIEGIKPIMDENDDGDLRYEIKDGLFKRLCHRAFNDPDNDYAIFIDEINRGNVSGIFGELITLIETDKRIGAKNEMTAKLPYSRSDFGVPRNVHIYGTMNTADRSIEALDTALRRRFSFVEMMTKPELLSKKEYYGINLQALLERINKRIEALIDRDHTIGHAYLIDVESDDDLKKAFKDKIIPLLQEYFYGDYGKIGLVLGEGFVMKDQVESSIFSDFDYEGREGLEQTTYKLIPFDQIEFKAALEKLMK
jgi:5-methylcytosine-specific restriction protein B